MRLIYKRKQDNKWSKVEEGLGVLKKGDIFGVVNDKTNKPVVDEEGYTAYEVIKEAYLLFSNIPSGLCAVDVKPLPDIELKEEYIQATPEKTEEDKKDDAIQSEEQRENNRESV